MSDDLNLIAEDWQRLTDCVRDAAAFRTGYAESEDKRALARVRERDAAKERVVAAARNMLAPKMFVVRQGGPWIMEPDALTELQAALAAAPGDKPALTEPGGVDTTPAGISNSCAEDGPGNDEGHTPGSVSAVRSPAKEETG